MVHQDYDNLEIFVIKDGGEDVSDIIDSFNDQRIIFIDRKVNLGLAYSFNEALRRASGKYICYLGDDDIFYGHHVSTLVEALETKTDCRAAYSDLYRTNCRVEDDGSRTVLGKVVDISRDFDRYLMLHFNHSLHVSLMHERSLLEEAGLYNEQLNVLLDWDLTRRLVFFTDFYHIHEITGEFYCPVEDCDRISVQRRKDEKDFNRNFLTIRTTRPPKPWRKIKDLSIILNAPRPNKQVGKTISGIWMRTFYPYKLYFPLPQSDFDKLETDMPNVETVIVQASATQAERIDAAVERCEGEYVAIVPGGFPVKPMWIEESLYALINSTVGGEGLELEGSTESLWAAVFVKSDFQNARRIFPDLSIRESLKAAGVTVRKLKPEEIPFQLDSLLHEARSEERDGNFAKAAEIFEYIAEQYQNQLWMNSLAAKAYFKAGLYRKADELCRRVNQERPTVDTLLIESRIKQKYKEYESAIILLRQAREILEGNQIEWTQEKTI